MLLVFGGPPAETAPGGWDYGAWDSGMWDGGTALALGLTDSATASDHAAVLPSVHITDAVPLIDQVAVGGSLNIIIGIDLADTVTATDRANVTGRQASGGTSRAAAAVYARTAVKTGRGTAAAVVSTRGKQAAKKVVVGR